MTVQLTPHRIQGFELDKTGNRWAVPTNGAETALFSGEAHTAWGAAVITIYRSLDGITPAALEDPQTLTAVQMSATVDCGGFPHLICQLSTNGTAGTYANLNCCTSRSVS